jgi:SAM-dependent MidA family methyltransferase
MLTAQELQRNFKNILSVCNKIDKLIEQKGIKGGFNLWTVGHEMMKANSDFYQSGVVLGEQSFTTLATEPENKRDLAMSFLTMIYSAWTLENKTEFNVLEIGAGSGDLMKEIFTIRNEVMASESSSEMHKKFFKSLKFNIVDYPQMIAIQREKLGGNAKEVNFIEHDISKNLLPRASFDFIYGNEIPDTQRVDFLEVKLDEKTGKKNYFLRAIKKSATGESSEVLAGISSSPEIIAEIGKNLFPIEDLEPGVYKLQFGFHALMNNIKQSLKPPFGAFILSDYYSFIEEHSTHNLWFTGIGGSNPNDHKILDEIGEPGRQLIEAKNKFGEVDVTYLPNVGRDTCESFDVMVTKCSEDYRSKAILCIKFRSENSINLLLKDPLFGGHLSSILNNTEKCDLELMGTELIDCRRSKQIRRAAGPNRDVNGISSRLQAVQLSNTSSIVK